MKETEAGFLNGREVTLFRYDPKVVSLEKVYQVAADQGAGDRVYQDLSGYKKAPFSEESLTALQNFLKKNP